MTQEMYDLWTAKRDKEAHANQGRRCSVFIMVAKYLISIGYDNIFLPAPARNKMWRSNFVPYIFSHDEIASVFRVAGKVDNLTRVDTPTFVVMLAILYTCGLRISELLNIKLQNINFTTGAIQILNSKNHVSRLIIASDSLREKLTEHHLNNTYPENIEYFLRTKNGMQVPYNSFRTLYHRALALAGIPKKDNCRHKYPRINDLRHTFAVHSLAKMVSYGYDTYTSLPLLSKFLGHKHITETEYYLRFTEENYDSVKILTNKIYKDIFPKVGGT